MMRKKVLFVGHTARNDRPFLDPSTRYRCFTPASALKRRGLMTSVVTQSAFEDDKSLADRYDYFVFHRPMLTEKLAPFLEEMKKSPRIIADFDDLIFDVKNSHLMPSYRFRNQRISQTAKYLSDNSAACTYFDRFSASTLPLVEKMRELYNAGKAVVTSNSLEPGYVGISKQIRAEMRKRGRPYKYGYFSGTATHDADFESIAPSIKKSLERYPEARMLVLGPASIPSSLLTFMDRIDHRSSVVPFHHLPYVMAQVEIVIAPLEWNAFTICKSGLKFFEAALVGCNVVATPIPDIDRFQSSMLRKCTTVQEWDDALLDPFATQRDDDHEISSILQMVDSEIIAGTWDKEFFQ